MEEYKGLVGLQAIQAKRADALADAERQKMVDALRDDPRAREMFLGEGVQAEPAPAYNAPVGGMPNQGGGGVSMPAPSEMPNGGVPAGTTAATPTSPWSYKAPQLQVGVTDPADPMQYDFSHLQKQPLQSAAEKFGGATEASRALRAGIGSRYSGGGQNG